MTEAQDRNAVVAEALTWLRTPYHHRAKVKGVGVDCAQFPLAVYEAAGLIPPTDVGAYAAAWHLHREQEMYLGWVRRFGREIGREATQRGDFAVWKFGRCFSHGAIILDPPTIIHATLLGRCVHISDMDRDDDLAAHEVKFFTRWGA